MPPIALRALDRRPDRSGPSTSSAAGPRIPGNMEVSVAQTQRISRRLGILLPLSFSLLESTPMVQAFDLRQYAGPKPRSRVSTSRAIRIVRTGHPPVAVQIADQVRCGSGMTFGRPSPDGAKMFPAFSHPARREEPVRVVTADPTPKSDAAPMPCRTAGPVVQVELLRYLEALASRNVPLIRAELRDRFGHGWAQFLRGLEKKRLVRFALGPSGGKFASHVAIRLVEQDILLQTQDCPAHITA